MEGTIALVPRVEYCIAHNPLLLQLLGHWFTFIYRKCEHLAVEDFVVKVLHDSRGSRRFTLALHPSFTSLLYHNLGDLSRGFSKLFLKNSVCRKGRTVTALTVKVRPSWTTPRTAEPTWVGSPPLDTNSISQLAQFVNPFSKKFQLASANSAPGRCPPVVDSAYLQRVPEGYCPLF